MPVEFIGMIGTRNVSEAHAPLGSIAGGAIDKEHVRRFARAHEEGGFDRVLIGYGSSGPDGFGVASYAAAHTDRLQFLLAHRPGFVQPTLAARKLATLDQFTDGRLAVHIISVGDDAEAARDGDWTDKATRYARAAEYLELVRREWTSTGPFDYEGQFYRTKGSYADVKPVNGQLPVYFGGSSEEAIEVGANHADTWAMWGEPVAAARAQIEDVRARAAGRGREIGISISLRPILGATEEKAWERAYDILEKVKGFRNGQPTRVPNNRGSQRLLEFAEDGDILDKRLFTAIAKVTGAAGNSTALVGTPEQVADSLLDYVDAGANTLLIRGYDPLEDAIEYGRDLLPLVRAEVNRRDRERSRELARV